MSNRSTKVIEELCSVISTLAEIVKEQETMIEQAKIAGIVFDSTTKEKKQSIKELGWLEDDE